jgi:hypothetical protein
MRKDKEADRIYRRNYYQNNKEKAAATIRAWRKKRLEWALETLGNKCVRCSSVENLHFDHIDPKTKVEAIQRMIGAKLEMLKIELAKCQLLCAKCHREKTRQNHEYGYAPTTHGTQQMYQRYKCRCDICRQYKREVDKKYKAKR